MPKKARASWKSQTVEGSVFERKPLSDEDIDRLTRKMKDTYGWYPQGFQLEGIRAQLEGVDIMIQAPTGAGKTAIAAAPHLMLKGMTIMASPLIALADEMVTMPPTHFES